MSAAGWYLSKHLDVPRLARGVSDPLFDCNDLYLATILLSTDLPIVVGKRRHMRHRSASSSATFRNVLAAVIVAQHRDLGAEHAAALEAIFAQDLRQRVTKTCVTILRRPFLLIR
jgi:hypothetical protein